jgi:hypothetical protein
MVTAYVTPAATITAVESVGSPAENDGDGDGPLTTTVKSSRTAVPNFVFESVIPNWRVRPCDEGAVGREELPPHATAQTAAHTTAAQIDA